MGAISNDPVQNAINGDIKDGIRLTLQHGCIGSAVKLIYSAIDTMAFLSMPAAQVEVTRTDFVKWADTAEQWTGSIRCCSASRRSICSCV